VTGRFTLLEWQSSRPCPRSSSSTRQIFSATAERGLSGPEIVKLTGAYAFEYGVNIPHETYPFATANKRTALAENLMKFSEPQRFQIIKALVDHEKIRSRNGEAAEKLKQQLLSRYGHLAGETSPTVNEELVEQTKHWLAKYPDVPKLYNQALEKHKGKIFTRNLLDDLRLALEKLVQTLLGNGRSLENQLSDLGGYIKAKGGSPEVQNMLVKLIEYYGK